MRLAVRVGNWWVSSPFLLSPPTIFSSARPPKAEPQPARQRAPPTRAQTHTRLKRPSSSAASSGEATRQRAEIVISARCLYVTCLLARQRLARFSPCQFLNLRPQRAQLFGQALIATLNMLNAGQRRGSLGTERGQDIRAASANICDRQRGSRQGGWPTHNTAMQIFLLAETADHL